MAFDRAHIYKLTKYPDRGMWVVTMRIYDTSGTSKWEGVHIRGTALTAITNIPNTKARRNALRRYLKKAIVASYDEWQKGIIAKESKVKLTQAKITVEVGAGDIT